MGLDFRRVVRIKERIWEFWVDIDGIVSFRIRWDSLRRVCNREMRDLRILKENGFRGGRFNE